MPSMLMLADTQFPRFTEGEGSDEKFDKVYNYLYMLLEQLRYTLTNLGSDNFNTSDLGEIGEVITEPLSDELQIFRRAMVGENGDISQIAQSGESIISRISSADGKISTLTQTSSSLASRITAAEGAISKIMQTPYRLELSVSNSGTSSTIELLANGTRISSADIEMTGFVTFSDLAGNKTTINGANIKTGTIEAIGISSCDIVGGTIVGGEIYSSNIYMEYGDGENTSIYFTYGGAQFGIMSFFGDGNQGSSYGIRLEAWQGGALKLYSAGNISIDAGGTVFLYNVQITEWNGTGAWMFKSDGIYRGTQKVVSV